MADTYLLVYPNLYLQSLLSHFRLIKPQAVDRTHVYGYPCDLVGAPDVLNNELARVTMAWTSPGGEVQVDDMEAFNRIQIEGCAPTRRNGRSSAWIRTSSSTRMGT